MDFCQEGDEYMSYETEENSNSKKRDNGLLFLIILFYYIPLLNKHLF